MSLNRLTLIGTLAAGIALLVGLQANASGSAEVLSFSNSSPHIVGIGFDASGNTPAPLGSSIAIAVVLHNIGTQFGRPSGAAVGRVLIQCTVLSEPVPTSPDGLCNGIVHVPNGYLTISGNGGFVEGRVDHYAVTGGVGPYANDRGQVTIDNGAQGSARATVALAP